MAFRRRRTFSRGFRRPRQLNWATAFTSGPINVPSGSISFSPITLQVEQETGSDQVVQRIRGNILTAEVNTATSIGQITYGICVEDAKDFTLGNVAALPNPRGGSLEDLEPDKWMWLASPWQHMLSTGPANLVGSLAVDVRAKRKLDITSQQVLLVMNNQSSTAINVSYYVRTLLKQVA